MVSEKAIVFLLIVAIVLSVVSIALTMSVNMEEVVDLLTPSPSSTGEVTNSASSGNVQLVIGEGG
jgi:hypothetical protein